MGEHEVLHLADERGVVGREGDGNGAMMGMRREEIANFMEGGNDVLLR